ncbi:MAG: hypothetical protein IIC18_08320 [Bacteroidetes bacterium]|nr:hypothetical protein [Bacteroidota bacterium]
MAYDETMAELEALSTAGGADVRRILREPGEAEEEDQDGPRVGRAPVGHR